MKALIFIFILYGVGCSQIPLKKHQNSEKPESLSGALVSGNLNVETYKTHSQIKILIKPKGEKGFELAETTVEKAKFNLNRQILFVNDKSEAQVKYWVDGLNGKVDLESMGFPPKGKTLISVVDSKANVIAVKDVPMETIFYMPKISLPQGKVKVGEEWSFQKRWRSLQTGWPFVLNIKSKLQGWYDCNGTYCAHITYEGVVVIPEDSPVKNGILTSELKGDFVYAPAGHQFIWSQSSAKETFLNENKKVLVNSCAASYQTQPLKVSKAFETKFKKSCK